MAADWDHNPFNSRLTKRPLCRLTCANPPEPIAPPDRPRPCRKVELSDRAVASIGQNAIRRNRPRAIVSRHYIPRRIEYPNQAIGQSKSDVTFRITASMSPLTSTKGRDASQGSERCESYNIVTAKTIHTLFVPIKWRNLEEWMRDQEGEREREKLDW